MIFKIFESLYNFMDKKGAKTKYERVSHYRLLIKTIFLTVQSDMLLTFATRQYISGKMKTQTQTRDFSGMETSVPKYYIGVG